MPQENKVTPRAESGVRVRSQGAEVVSSGVSYRTWCKHKEVEALILDGNGEIIRRGSVTLPRPLQFFTDHNAELGKAITQGRRREFRHFSAFRDPQLLETIPDPQAPETFLTSKLRWDEMHEAQHAGLLLLYWEFLELRRTHPVFRDRARENRVVLDLGDGIVALLYGRVGEFHCAVISDLVGGHKMPSLDDARLAPGEGRDWRPLLSSNEARFGADGSEPFSVPTTLILESI